MLTILVLLYQDNACILHCKSVGDCGFALINHNHTLYSPDLAPSDLTIFCSTIRVKKKKEREKKKKNSTEKQHQTDCRPFSPSSRSGCRSPFCPRLLSSIIQVYYLKVIYFRLEFSFYNFARPQIRKIKSFAKIMFTIESNSKCSRLVKLIPAKLLLI